VWSVEHKVRIIAQAAGLASDELNEFRERCGVELSRLKRRRLALEEAGESVGVMKQIGRLQRELTRTHRAPAETATLLIREPIERLIRHGGDHVGENIEEANVNCAI
jgi:hypothetical protein